MAYTEIKQRNSKKYYYRVISIRNKNKISKKRKYLGVNLSKQELLVNEQEADKELNIKIKNLNIEKIKKKIVEILKKYNIKRAGIFGSYAKGKQKNNSDIDLLIEPSESMGFEFYGMNTELEKKLGKKVHLVTYKYISPYIKENILNEEIKII